VLRGLSLERGIVENVLIGGSHIWWTGLGFVPTVEPA